MAGEWLKFDSSLPEKPETLALTVAMGWDDPDLTVGKLMRVFRWFDQQTTDGNAAGVTPALLDRLIGVTGFSNALAKVGWLVISEAGLSLANFEKHNGATAKSRAQTAKRVANHRASEPPTKPCNAATVTPALAREEKRREEEKTSTSLRSVEARAERLPKDWTLPSEWQSWAEAERPDLDATVMACTFADYWHAKPGKDGRKLDWQATWRNWVRNQREAQRPQGRAPPESFRAQELRIAEERYAQATGKSIPHRTRPEPLQEVFDVTPRTLG